jgi:hypothetical protein
MFTEFAPMFPVLFAGMAIGVMLMAIVQRYAKRRKKTQLERPRWNGRYPRDAERP